MALMSVMASQTHMYPQLVHIKYVKLFACLLYFNKVINKTKIFLHKKIKCSWPRVGSYLYQQEIVCPEEPPSFTSQHFQKTSKQQTSVFILFFLQEVEAKMVQKYTHEFPFDRLQSSRQPLLLKVVAFMF